MNGNQIKILIALIIHIPLIRLHSELSPLHMPHLLYLAEDPKIPSHPAAIHCPLTQTSDDSGLHLKHRIRKVLQH